MTHRISFYSFLIVLLLATVGCKDKNEGETTPPSTTGQLKITLDTRWQDESYNDTAVVQDAYGNQLRIDAFVSYISNLRLLKSDGSTHLLKDYSLINFASNNVLTFDVPAGEYTGLQFLIGVPADVNTDTDPAQYPNDHVLSVPGSQGMFWNWNTGYIFTKLEGKADTSGTNQPLLYGFAYHTGDDHYSKTATLYKDVSISNGATHNETLRLQIDKIFSPDNGTDIDLTVNPSFHSPGPLMDAFATNFAHAFTLE